MAQAPEIILKVYPPQSGTAEHVLYPVSLEIHASWNAPMELSGTFTNVHPDDWPEQGNAAYPIQQGNFCKLQHDSTNAFQGKWEAVTRTQADGRATVVFMARDKMAVEERTVASISLTNIASASKEFYGFNKYTGPLDVGGGSLTSPTRVQLYAGKVRDGDPWPHAWYPKYNSAAWLPATGTARDLTDLSFYDTLGANVGATDTEIKLSQNWIGAPQSGFVSITTGGDEEWIAYDGYNWDEVTGYFWLNNCVRQATNGWLGSHARRTHTAGDTVYFRIPRRMHFAHPALIEGYASAETLYEAVPDTHWTLNPEEFGVSWQSEPLALGQRGADGSGYAGRTAYDTMWITVGYFDEDNVGGTALYLGAFLKALYEQEIAKLGPGFGPDSPETCTVDNQLSPDIPITNVRVVKPGMTIRDIREALLSDLGLNRGQGNDAIAVDYDPAQDKIIIRYVAQATTPDHYYSGEHNITEALPDQPASAIVVRSSGNDEVNKLASTRIFHTAIDPTLAGEPIGAHKFGDDGGASGFPNVKGWKHSLVNYDGGGGGIYLTLAYPHAYNITSIIGNVSYPNLLTDDSDKTGMLLAFKTQPSAANQLFAWTPDAIGSSDDQHPDLFRTTKCIVGFDLAGTTSENATTRLLDIQMLGYRDIVPAGSSAPSGTAIGMGTGSRLIMPPGTYDRPEPVKWEFDCDEIINGISLYVRKLPKTQAVSSYFSGTYPFILPLLEIAIFAEPYRTDIVQARASYSTSDPAGYVTAPNTEGKILGSSMGQHNTHVMDIGPASRAAARGIGVLQLVTGWKQSQPRTYINRSTGIDLGGLPVRGNTAQHTDEFQAVIEEYTYRMEGGRRELTISSRNYLNSLYGLKN